MNEQQVFWLGCIATTIGFVSLLFIFAHLWRCANRPFEDGEQRELAKKLSLDPAWGLIQPGDLVMGPDRTLKLVIGLTRSGIFLVDTFRDSMNGERGMPTFLPVFKKPRLVDEVSPILRGDSRILITSGLAMEARTVRGEPRFIEAALEFLDQQVSKRKS